MWLLWVHGKGLALSPWPISVVCYNVILKWRPFSAYFFKVCLILFWKAVVAFVSSPIFCCYPPTLATSTAFGENRNAVQRISCKINSAVWFNFFFNFTHLCLAHRRGSNLLENKMLFVVMMNCMGSRTPNCSYFWNVYIVLFYKLNSGWMIIHNQLLVEDNIMANNLLDYNITTNWLNYY